MHHGRPNAMPVMCQKIALESGVYNPPVISPRKTMFQWLRSGSGFVLVGAFLCGTKLVVYRAGIRNY